MAGPVRSGLGGFSFDRVRAVGAGCAIYILVFLLRFAGQGAYLQRMGRPPIEIIALASFLFLIVFTILASWRTLAILSWVGAGMIAFQLLDLPALVLEELWALLAISLGLGIPFLLLLEVILTMEGGTARARVVFRGIPLVKAVTITLVVFGAMALSFSYLGMLSDYARSPEAATFQAAMIAGLTTMVFGWILLCRPRKAEVEG